MSSYGIEVKNGARWSFHSFKPSEGEAINEARNLLKQKIADEVKVIAKDDEGNEDIVFNEDQKSIRKKAGLGQISQAPYCKVVIDIFSEVSRKCIRQLLRDYFDQTVITPTELLHSDRSIEKFSDSSLCANALDRVAALQATKAGVNEQERRDALYDLIQGAQDLARESGRDEIQAGKLNDYLANIGSLKDPNIRYKAMLSLSTLTLQAPSWEGKFIALFDLVGDIEPKDLHENTVDLLDDIISEMLAVPSVVLEMLGQQPDRYNAMNVLTKLCIGAYKAHKWDTPGLKHLSELLSVLPMKRCRTMLSERIEQMFRSRSALTKGDMFEEKHAFKQLFPLFISKSGNILGGEGMAEALTICGARSFNRDRSLDKPSEAIEYIVDSLDAPILQLRFLLSLSKTQFGKDCSTIVCDFIPKFMEGPEHVHDIVHYRLPTKRKIKILTDMQKSALPVDLPQQMNMQLVEWIDNLLYGYLDEERIIDKMDSPEESLFIRATNLLQFCSSGLLIEGKTLNWVRERVQEHLRQPNFVEKFTEAADTTNKKELMITQLHVMLKKAGLNQ